jgi:drug/metabolite transporter (DMT)-like permease
MEDYDKAHPPDPNISESQVGWDADYEYRPPTAVKAIYTVEFPAALLAGWGGHLPGHDLYSQSNANWRRLFRSFASVRTRILILDSILIVAIYAQWWLVGRRLDHLRLAERRMRWIQVPALVITSAGVLMALLSRGTRVWELIAILAAFLALLAWVVLILEAATAFGKLAFQYFRGESASV